MLSFILLGFASSTCFALTLSQLASFTYTNGAFPAAGLIVSTNGNLYGTTSAGGQYGLGTVFTVDLTGKVTVLASFDGTNGSQPFSALVRGTDGNFYGTTSTGGDFGKGTVFVMSPDGSLVTLGSFDGANGNSPRSPLLQASNGNLYGTTYAGGAYNQGVFYSVTPLAILALTSTANHQQIIPDARAGGSINTLVSFNTTNGAKPLGQLALDRSGSGVIYGTTAAGGAYGLGTVFSWQPGAGGDVTTLHSFGPSPEGSAPQGGLLLATDGSLYGTTAGGGTNTGGTVFRCRLNGTVTSLYSFVGTNTALGAIPLGPLTQASDGNFYGTTSTGGTANKGTLFGISPGGVFTNLYSFLGVGPGGDPFSAGLVQASDGNLYGISYDGGRYQAGTVYRVSGFPPLIVNTPGAQVAASGTTVTFTVSATGSTTLKYHWLWNSNFLADGGRIAGAATSTLTISNVSMANAGGYSVQVLNSAGSVTSAVAVLTVLAPPIVRISNPTSGSVLKRSVISVTGTAWDNLPVTLVTYQINDGGWRMARPVGGWSTWAADNLQLTPGTNVFQVYATSAIGVPSTTNTAMFIYSVGTTPLVLITNGPGIATPNYNGRSLDVSRTYTVTAVPSAGFVLSNWIQSVNGQVINSTDSLLTSFTMQSNLVLQANFVPSPFLTVTGAYHGLFFNTNQVDQQSSGYAALTVTPFGAFSGYLLMGPARLTVSGRFHLDGTAQVNVSRQGWTTPISLDLTLGGEAGSPEIRGVVSGNSVWTATLLAFRAPFDGKTRIAPSAGRYTLVLPGVPGSQMEPGGDGYLAVSVARNGQIQASGNLADAATVLRTTPLLANNYWPLYVPMYEGKGSLMGWLWFTNVSPSLRGELNWIRPPVVSAKRYPGGFVELIDVLGSAYHAPGAGKNQLTYTNAEFIAIGGNLPAAGPGTVGALTNDFQFGRNNRVFQAPAGSKLAITFNPENGLFGGSVRDTNSNRTLSFTGAVLPEWEVARGYFLGTNQSGRILLQPSP